MAELREEALAMVKQQKFENLKNIEVMSRVTKIEGTPKKRVQSRNKKLMGSVGISEYVKQIPRTFIDLSMDDSNPIGGMPIKSWQTAYKDQHRRSKSFSQNSLSLHVEDVKEQAQILKRTQGSPVI